MSGIIVAFPKEEDAKAIRTILVRSGFDVFAVCTTGAGALQAADRLSEGIIVCGYRLRDMVYSQLFTLTAPAFSMMLIASARSVSDERPLGVYFLDMPLKVHALIDGIRMLQEEILLEKRKRKKQARRSASQQMVIDRAKELLMKKNRMTEEEAHRYLQKTSMDNGTGLLETAGMLLSLMEDDQ